VIALFNRFRVGGFTGAGSPAEIQPWREVGWIFRDGLVVVIERQGGETRVRSALI
jgi:hypothetical protein